MNDNTKIIKDAVVENALFSRSIHLDSIKLTNEASDKLSTELSFISGTIAGAITIFFEKVAPKGFEQKIILFVLIFFTITTIAFGLINKYLIYLFHKNNELISSARKAHIWMSGRNKITNLKTDEEIVDLYKKLLHEEKDELLSLKLNSEHWPLNYQIISLIITTIFVILYLVMKIFSN